jgi:hypothetical protein
MTRAIIDIFAMKTCTKLSPKLVGHPVGSRRMLRGPFPVPCWWGQNAYWRTADRDSNRTLMNPKPRAKRGKQAHVF